MKNKMIPPPRQVPKKKPPPPQVVFTAVEQEIQGTASIEQPENERPEKVVEPKEEVKTEVPAQKVEQIQIEEKSEEVPVQNPAFQQVVESVIIVPGIVKKPPVMMKAHIKKSGKTPPPMGRPPVIPPKVEQSTPAPAVKKVEETAEENIQAVRQPAPVEDKIEQKQPAVIQQPIVKQQVKEEISLPEPTPRVEPEIVRIAPRAPIANKKSTKKPGPPPKMPAIPVFAKVVEPESKPEDAPADSPPQQQPAKTPQPPAQTKIEEKSEPMPVEQKQKEQIDPVPTVPTHKDVIQTPSPNINSKSDILPPSQSVRGPNASVIQAPAAKSKMAEKLEQLRRAKEKMLNDDASLNDEDEKNQFSESGLNQSDEITEQKFEQERKEAIVEEIKPARPQIVVKEEVPAQVITPVIVPRMAPPPVKAPIKAPGRQPPTFPQKPIPIQKPKPVVAEQPETKVEEKEIQEEKEMKEGPKVLATTQTVANPSINYVEPTISSEQPKQKLDLTLKVSGSQPKNNSQIKSLLQRYHGLKSTYLSNLRQLDELIHFQKQQEDSQIDKINKLLNELHRKNEAIKQICSVKELPVNDGPVAV